jgi:hypothetical protein
VKVYLIAIRWSAQPRTQEVEKALEAVGTWLRFNNNIYLLRTSKTAADIFSVLAKVLTKEDQELITRLQQDDYSGWASNWINVWIEESFKA